jgi:Ca2+-binding RTX toxin-like protein
MVISSVRIFQEGTVIESLETRRLMSVSFAKASGTATVTGTDKPDLIEFGSGQVLLTVVETTSGIRTTTNLDIVKVKKIVVNAGAGTDTIILGKTPIPAFVRGGRGNDVISGGFANDSLFGEGGDDYLNGSDGKDRLDGGTEGDELYGGAQLDIVDYSGRTGNLTIGIGTLPDDGEAGEGDNVHTDIEIVFCGSGNDQVSTTSSKAVQLYGFAGNDTLMGGRGNDLLDGGTGRDSLVGRAGNDTFRDADGEKDTMDGGSGTDIADRLDSGLDVLISIP